MGRWWNCWDRVDWRMPGCWLLIAMVAIFGVWPWGWYALYWLGWWRP